jgi:hypothetical protein
MTIYTQIPQQPFPFYTVIQISILVPYPAYVHHVQKAGDRRRSEAPIGDRPNFSFHFSFSGSVTESRRSARFSDSARQPWLCSFACLLHDPDVYARSSSDILYWTLCLLTAGEARARRVCRVGSLGISRALMGSGYIWRAHACACVAVKRVFRAVGRVGFRFHGVTAAMEGFVAKSFVCAGLASCDS